MSNTQRLTALGMSTQLAKETATQLANAAKSTDAEIAAAIAAKTEIAALTPASTAADIVAALQAP